ncbi:Protein yellow [Eumeta japonica]|uniref:Protein yellow n=1 Tax=Eumeta variegata TaxID=151549 RepID=A0A4C1XI53_EUMVA|nr:Protein yellow [Eumeta japonica]
MSADTRIEAHHRRAHTRTISRIRVHEHNAVLQQLKRKVTSIEKDQQWPRFMSVCRLIDGDRPICIEFVSRPQRRKFRDVPSRYTLLMNMQIYHLAKSHLSKRIRLDDRRSFYSTHTDVCMHLRRRLRTQVERVSELKIAEESVEFSTKCAAVESFQPYSHYTALRENKNFANSHQRFNTERERTGEAGKSVARRSTDHPEVLDSCKAEMGPGFDRFFLLSFCLACCWPGLGARNNLRIIRQWAEPEFAFPDEATKERALQQGDYVPGNSVFLDVDVHHRQGAQQSRIFITNPRFANGRPITLGTVDEMGKIVAYPDYSWHDNQGSNCDGMTSVFRVAIDECERLWVLDAGKIGDHQHCPPQLLAFHLATDELIYRHRFNSSVYNEASLFITPAVDLRGGPGNCQDTYVYVADVSGFALVVVDVARDRSWRVKHRHFYPYPNRGSFTIDVMVEQTYHLVFAQIDRLEKTLGDSIQLSHHFSIVSALAADTGRLAKRMRASCFKYPAIALLRQAADGHRGGLSHSDIGAVRDECCGEASSYTMQRESFDLMDGVFGLALDPMHNKDGKQDRYLYFHALASTTENVVRTSVLRNESFIEHPDADPRDINAFPEERSSQSAAEAIDRNGIMYFGLMDPPSIWCWNTATEYSPQNFHRIALNHETLQFASGVKVVNNLKGEQELWILTCSFQRVMTGTMTADRTNFRIHAEKIPTLIENSPCKVTPKDRRHGYHANLITPTNYHRGPFRYGVASYL